MYRAAPLLVEGLAGRIGNLARRAVHPPGATVAFIGTPGGGRASVMQAVARDLAPAALTTLEHDYDESYWVDLRVVFDAPEYARKFHDVVLADSAQPLPSIVAAVERAILRWLECRVESRFPRLMVGDNPPAARLLQNLCRRRIPWVSELFEMLLNCSIECAIRSPILIRHRDRARHAHRQPRHGDAAGDDRPQPARLGLPDDRGQRRGRTGREDPRAGARRPQRHRRRERGGHARRALALHCRWRQPGPRDGKATDCRSQATC